MPRVKCIIKIKIEFKTIQKIQKIIINNKKTFFNIKK